MRSILIEDRGHHGQNRCRGRSFRWGGFSVGATVICAQLAIAQVKSDLGEQFRTDAPAAWNAYYSFLNRLQGRTAFKLTIKEKLSGAGYGELKQNGQCQLYLYQPTTGSSLQGELSAFNPRYSFLLGRRAKESPWALTEVVVGTPTEKESRAVYDTRTRVNQILALVRLERTKLIDLVARPSFHILGAKRIKWEGVDCVEIRFDNSHPFDKNAVPFCPEQRGTLILDASRSWCLRTAEIECEYSADPPAVSKTVTTRIVTTLRDGKTGFPIPVRMVITNDVMKHEFEFKLEEPAQLPGDEEFTLSAFNLPEPGTGGRSRWYVWLALAGICCLVAGCILWRFAIRRGAT